MVCGLSPKTNKVNHIYIYIYIYICERRNKRLGDFKQGYYFIKKRVFFQIYQGAFFIQFVYDSILAWNVMQCHARVCNGLGHFAFGP